VGAVWTTPDADDPAGQADQLHSGHFFIDPSTPARQAAMKTMSLGALFNALPLRWKEGLK
jgi:hypothetical protein